MSGQFRGAKAFEPVACRPCRLARINANASPRHHFRISVTAYCQLPGKPSGVSIVGAVLRRRRVTYSRARL